MFNFGEECCFHLLGFIDNLFQTSPCSYIGDVFFSFIVKSFVPINVNIYYSFLLFFFIKIINFLNWKILNREKFTLENIKQSIFCLRNSKSWKITIFQSIKLLLHRQKFQLHIYSGLMRENNLFIQYRSQSCYSFCTLV